jgi:methyl-accepting chemotaxis protein
MNRGEHVSGKQYKTISALSFSIIFSFFLSLVLFRTAGVAISLKIVLFSAVIVLPCLLSSVFLYSRFRYMMRLSDAANDASQTDTAAADNGGKEVSSAMTDTAAADEKKAEEKQLAEIADASCNIASRARLLYPVIGELCSSISHSLSSTTEPISAELLHIKQSNEIFLKNISSYESDIKDKAAIIRLHNESDMFNNDLKSLSNTIEDVFSTLNGHMVELKTVSSHIGDIAGDISEISEQIRILSFNASIEAARAGDAGSGFRIIAGEIKRLSSDTEGRLAEIRKMLNETRIIFGNIAAGLDENKVKILDVVAQRQTGFAVFEQTLDGYFPKLEKLYDGVLGIINSLTKSMDVISPVVQLHEITSQEIGNLKLVTGDFCTYVEKKAENTCPSPVPEPGKEAASTIASEIRHRLTTENELRALERGIRQTVPDTDIDIAINNRRIELF